MHMAAGVWDKLEGALSGPGSLGGFGLSVEQKPLLGCKFVICPIHTVSLRRDFPVPKWGKVMLLTIENFYVGPKLFFKKVTCSNSNVH